MTRWSDEEMELAFIAGAQACREMMARFVEQGGDDSTAASIRANWNPAWSLADPGAPASVEDDPFGTLYAIKDAIVAKAEQS